MFEEEKDRARSYYLVSTAGGKPCILGRHTRWIEGSKKPMPVISSYQPGKGKKGGEMP